MKILLICLNFHPEDSAIGQYSTETALYLKSQGCEVTVIAGFPYYPQWKIWPEYKDKGFFLKDDFQGIEVLRFKQYVPSSPIMFKRLLHIGSFTFGNLYNIFRARKNEVVIAIVPFITSVILGKLHNLFFQSKTWTHIQDFEIEAMKNSDIHESGEILINVAEGIEKKLLKKSHRLSTISPQMVDKLRDKGLKNPYYFPNFIDIDKYTFHLETRHAYFDKSKFNILYSGNIGEKQDWDLFVKLVKECSSNVYLKFMVVGGGSKKDWLHNKLIEAENVEFFESIPKVDLPQFLKSADLHILLQKQSIINSVMPSKLISMIASNIPVLVVANEASGLRKIIEDSKSGYCFDTYEPLFLKKIIIDFQNLKLGDHSYKSNGLGYIRDHFSKKLVLESFYSELMQFKE